MSVGGCARNEGMDPGAYSSASCAADQHLDKRATKKRKNHNKKKK
jgi:hypothetical protein